MTGKSGVGDICVLFINYDLLCSLTDIDGRQSYKDSGLQYIGPENGIQTEWLFIIPLFSCKSSTD